MLCIEHLISSAYHAIDDHWSYEHWLEQTSTQDNLECVCAKPHEIWAIAQYVYFSIKPYIEWDKEDEMIKQYGYKLEDKR
jgi:hypothetical protein